MSNALGGIAAPGATALPLYAVRPAALEAFLETLAAPQRAYLKHQNFTAAAKSLALLPDADGLAGAVLGLGEDTSPFAFGGFAFGSLAAALPAGSVWRLVPGDFAADDAALGFLLGAYSYDRLKPRVKPPAEVERIKGAALSARFPALNAVGIGSDRAPEAVFFSWTGSRAPADAPLISLCGKGVCFDTGGYDLKPSSAMLRMKKDMGGAAIILGLARLVMAFDLPLRLQVRIGCVENSISGHAMRPSDVLQTHAGLSVEVGNTDAEGRLVLCDLLAEAAAENPHWLIDAATLTGAARVALGPDIPALFSNNAALAKAILNAGEAAQDPLWQLPLWLDYNSWLDSNIADTNTVSSKPFAGAIVAALFLRRFVPDTVAWAHIDVYAWNDQTRPGRPEGGEAQTLRALFVALETYSTNT
jgi:leucyl aminopeptidase